MTTDITAQKSLEERVRDRVHESIGDLIQPDDIKQIVERGIDDFLFKPRQVERKGGWSNGVDHEVSLVQELVNKHLKVEVSRQVEQWIADNSDTLKIQMQAAIAKGAGSAVLSALDERFAAVFESALRNFQQQGLLP